MIGEVTAVLEVPALLPVATVARVLACSSERTTPLLVWMAAR